MRWSFQTIFQYYARKGYGHFLYRRAPSIIEKQFCKTTILKLSSIFKLDLKNLASNSFENMETPLHEKCPRSEFSGPHFPVFGLTTERYGISPGIRFDSAKIRTRKTLNIIRGNLYYLTLLFPIPDERKLT